MLEASWYCVLEASWYCECLMLIMLIMLVSAYLLLVNALHVLCLLSYVSILHRYIIRCLIPYTVFVFALTSALILLSSI